MSKYIHSHHEPFYSLWIRHELHLLVSLSKKNTPVRVCIEQHSQPGFIIIFKHCLPSQPIYRVKSCCPIVSSVGLLLLHTDVAIFGL